MDHAGIVPMPAPEALNLFDAGLRLNRATVVLSRLDLVGLRSRASAGQAPVSPVLDTLVSPGARPAVEAAETTTDGASAAALRELALPELRRRLLRLVRENIAEVLGHPLPDSVGVERGLLDLGFDSLMAVELRNRLVARTAVPLPITALFDHPGAARLAAYLSSELAKQRSEAVIADIGDWEAGLTALDLTDETRAVITSRLGDILRKLSTPESSSGRSAVHLTEIANLVDSAAGDELFELIDRHLGSK
jgi:acyl carrier protein